MSLRLTPRLLWFCAAVTAAGIAVTGASRALFPWLSFLKMGYWNALLALAYLTAFLLCLRVYGDQVRGSRMRLAWLCLTISCVFDFVRQIFEVAGALWGLNRLLPGVMGFRSVPITLALILLALGLIQMIPPLLATGLRLRLRWTDIFWIAAILAIVISILLQRENLSDAASPFPLLALLQALSPVLLSVSAVVIVLLYRLSCQMGHGEYAAFLTLMVLFFAARMLALLVRVSPVISQNDFLAVPIVAMSGGGSWLFALAILRRWELSKSADKLAWRFTSSHRS